MIIILLLILCTITFFCEWNICKNQRVKMTHNDVKILPSYTFAILSTIVLLLMIGIAVGNFHNHLGMVSKTNCTRQKLDVNYPYKMMMYTPLGSKEKHTLVIYKHTVNGKAHKTPISIHETNNIKRVNGTVGHIKVQKQYYGYNSLGTKLMFQLVNPKQMKHTTRTFYVPKNWNLLSVSQAKNMKLIIKKLAKKQEQQAKTPQGKAMVQQLVQQKIQTAMTSPEAMHTVKNNISMAKPKFNKLSPVQQQKIMQKYMTQSIIHDMKFQQEQKIVRQAIQLAKQRPIGYQG